MALWELPELGEDMGVFLWWNHKNTPIYPLFHGDSQRPDFISTQAIGSGILMVRFLKVQNPREQG